MTIKFWFALNEVMFESLSFLSLPVPVERPLVTILHTTDFKPEPLGPPPCPVFSLSATSCYHLSFSCFLLLTSGFKPFM